MDIGSISNNYVNTLGQTASTASSGSSKIEKSLKSDMSGSTDEELMSVCKEFEAYFIEQVFKEMKNSIVPAEESEGANKTLLDYYEGELTTEYAKSASDQQENGLAQMLYEQMKRNYE